MLVNSATRDLLDTLPLNYATYRLHPEILTRFSDPTSTPKSFDGRVGTILENDYLVSSPNTNVLFDPPLLSRRVRLRRDLHFSHDDPLFYPQPFDEHRPHLPLIRAPSTDPNHPFAIAWTIPLDEHFDNRAGNILYDAAILDTTFYLRIKSLADSVLKTIPANNNDSDGFLTQGAIQVDRMLSLLQTAASREDIRLRVAFLQRTILELDARIQYHAQQWATVSRRNRQNNNIPDSLDVIGAFADDFSVLDTLYHLGIPVWFVRPVKKTPDARIDCSAPLIAENSLRIIDLPSGFQLDGTDAEPHHKVIWEGLHNKPERYAAMNAYLHSLLYPPSSFGSKQPRSLPSYQRATSIRASPYRPSPHASSSSSYSRQSGSSDLHPATRPKPYSRIEVKKPQIHKQGVNTFLRVNAPAMPPANPAWTHALALHSSYNQSLQRPEIVESGFFLPPPRLIDGPKQIYSRMFYYGTWLKVRPLILQTLDGLTTKPLNLSAKRWRCLLDIVGGRVPGKSEDTKTSIYRVEMRNLLDTLLSKYNTPSFDLNDSTPRVEQFHEHLVDCRSEPPPTQIASKILWEITELSFRHELVALDRRLDQSGVSLPERDTLLDACWVGSRYQPEIARANEGLAAPDIQQRIPYIRALHQLTMSWAGDKPEELYSAFPGNPDAHNYISLVERVEQSLVNFYTTSFLIVFGRAASIPHFISTS